jgi:hypothetical protein
MKNKSNQSPSDALTALYTLVCDKNCRELIVGCLIKLRLSIGIKMYSINTAVEQGFQRHSGFGTFFITGF